MYRKIDKCSVKLRLESIITDILKNIQVWIFFLWQPVHYILTDLVHYENFKIHKRVFIFYLKKFGVCDMLPVGNMSVMGQKLLKY